jgi:GAF domain-containing protein
MIVGDTLQDDRFADNPFVISGPRIRFYAGFPIFHSNGRCLGSLCLIDIRPRHYPPSMIQRFEDLASLIQQEMNASPQPAKA